MSELKCCPFCGGNVTAYADRYEKVMIECDNCKMYFGVQLEIGCELKDGWKATFNSKEDAIKQWNTRKPITNIVDKLEKNSQYCVPLGGQSFTGIKLETAVNIVKQEINNGLE